MSDVEIRNPHSILAALESRPKEVLSIVLPKELSGAWKEVEKKASALNVKLEDSAKTSQKGKNRKQMKEEGGRIGGGTARVRPKEGVSLETLFSDAKEGDVWLALDSLQDPRNIGAIFRTAAFYGVRGILLTQARSASLGGAVYDVAAGGMESVPYSVHANLQNAFQTAKEKGLWILGTSENSSDNLSQFSNDRSWLLVLGNEESGLRRLTLENCDVACKIAAKGKVQSLNVSVAAGIVMAHFLGVS